MSRLMESANWASMRRVAGARGVSSYLNTGDDTAKGFFESQ